MILLLLQGALASDEHELPAAVDLPTPGVIPEGAPQTVRVPAGAPLQEILNGLPAHSVVHLESGRYAGPLVIDRPLELAGIEGTILEGGGKGSVLTLVADGISVHDLAIEGSGSVASDGDAGIRLAGRHLSLERLRLTGVLTGLDLRQVRDSIVQDCFISGRDDLPLGQRGDGIRLWESYGNRLENNHLFGVRDLVIWYSDNNQILHNWVEHSRYGTHFMHASANVVTGNRYEHDVVGVFVMYSEGITLQDNLITAGRSAAGVGLGFKESNGVLVERNRILGSTTGIYLDNTPHRPDSSAIFRGNTIAFEHVGLRVHSHQSGATFEDNEFHENTTQVAADGNANALACQFLHNRWSDYAGYDLDGDGYGDVPWEARSVSDSLRDRFPTLAFFFGTPAVWLTDLLGSVVPLFSPAPVARDDRPRMRHD